LLIFENGDYRAVASRLPNGMAWTAVGSAGIRCYKPLLVKSSPFIN
jgi:hypothetical protein